MLKTVTETFCFILLAILYTYMLKQILKSDIKIMTKKNIFLFSSLIFVAVISYTSEYSIETVFLRFVANIIVYKLVFDESIGKITVLCTLVMLINLIGDIVNASILMNFYSLEEIRTVPRVMIIANSIALINTYIIFNIKPVKNKLKLISKDLNDNNIFSIIIISISIFLLFVCILYNLGDAFTFNMKYFINIMIVVIFVIVLIIFFIDNNKYQKLLEENDSLFKYNQSFENSIDKISLSNHEFNNQLIMLKGYIEDNKKGKSLNIINEMIVEAKKQDSNILGSLKNIPKGGVKVLLYHKIIVAIDNKLKVSLDVSKTIKGKLKKLNIDQLKLICNLIGIYLDNAIEASKESKKKLIGIEIYALDNKINFVFSNSLKNENIDIEKLDRNGYTTKGKNHGRGLYLAKKLLQKTELVDAETTIINKMYVQKMVINTQKI